MTANASPSPAMDPKPRDPGKPALSLIAELSGIDDVARAMAYGAGKYGRGSWAAGDNLESVYLDAALRHLFAHCRGELRDPESGFPHMAHAAASILIALSKRAAGSLVANLTFNPERSRSIQAWRVTQAYEARATQVEPRRDGVTA